MMTIHRNHQQKEYDLVILERKRIFFARFKTIEFKFFCKTNEFIFRIQILISFHWLSRFVNQPNLQTSNAALNSVNVQMANCTLIANQSMNLSNFGAESGTVLSYPCTINQPMFVNYCPGAIIQAQSSAVYYYLSPEANVYRNQFVYFNPAPTNQQISIGNVQIPIQHSVLQNEFIPMNRALFEKYNISFNDAL